MAINVSKLIFSPTLQEMLVGKDGEPLVNGVIYLYSNTSRTTFKNWYYQNGNVEPYSYLPLPNPMTLSAAGTIVDCGGNDVIPGFYPLSETDNTTVEKYFIQVFDQYGTLQFSRYNFPVVPDNNIIPSGIQDIRQLIVNNRFWRNVGTLDLTSTTTVVVCPDQHDGFSTGTAGSGAPINGYLRNITFNKNATGRAETVTFQQFNLSATPVLTGDITPEFYLNHVTTGISGSETLKYYQFPLSLHLRSLSGVDAAISIQAIDNSGTNSTISLSWFAFQGTGQTTPTPTPFYTATLTTEWQKYTVQATIPSDFGTGITSGPGDDALYLWVGIEPSKVMNISVAVPSVYLLSDENEIPINDFRSYDEINAIISSPRTGDVRIALNNYYNWGWVPMNNGAIGYTGSATSNFPLTRNNIDCWPLYNLIWNSFNAYSTGTSSAGTNLFAQMYTNTGTAVGYGPNVTGPSTALQDWNAGKFISLTKQLGQVILGTVPASALLAATSTFLGYASTITATSSTGLLITTMQAMNIFKGMPVIFSNSGGALPTGISANVVYYITADASFAATTFHISTSFANAMAGTAISYTDAGSGTNTITYAFAGNVEGEYAHTQLLGELAAHTHTTNLTPSGVLGIPAAQLMSISGTQATGSTGNSTPFNVTQPGTFLNIYMKL